MGAPKITVKYTLKERGKGKVSSTSDPYTFDTEQDLMDFTKDAIITVALDALIEEQAMGFDENPVVTVDGKRGKKVSDVNPFGKIQFNSKQDIKEILRFAFQSIKERTFRVTGRYAENHIVTLNGKQVANDESSFNNWLDSKESFEARDRVRFINTAPYARRLERAGITATNRGPGRKAPKMRDAKKSEKQKAGTRFQVPNGIYALSYRAILRKYSTNALIKFDLLPGSSMGVTGPNTTYKRGKSKGMSYLYPTILIYATPSGLRGLS